MTLRVGRRYLGERPAGLPAATPTAPATGSGEAKGGEAKGGEGDAGGDGIQEADHELGGIIWQLGRDPKKLTQMIWVFRLVVWK